MSAPGTPVLICEAVTAWLAMVRYLSHLSHRRHRHQRSSRAWLRALQNWLQRH